MLKNSCLFHLPIEQVSEPADGECLVNQWWAVDPEKGIAFFAVLSDPMSYAKPQCNQAKEIAERVRDLLYPDHEIRRIPIVFMQHANRELRRLRQEYQEQRAEPSVAPRF